MRRPHCPAVWHNSLLRYVHSTLKKLERLAAHLSSQANHYNQNSTNSYRDFNEFVSLPQISEYTNPPTDESSCRMPRMVQICRNNFILKEELRINSWKYPKPKRPKSHMKPPSRLMSMMMQQFFP